MIKNFIKMFKYLIKKLKHPKKILSIQEKSSKEITLQNNNEIIKTHIARSEFNFLKYPFFYLGPRRKSSSEIKIEHKDKSGNTAYWHVLSSSKSKLPTGFARKIHKGIVEKKINLLQKPIPRLIGLGSLAQICRDLGLKSLETNRVKKALEDIALTTIRVKNTLKTKNKERGGKYLDGIFHLYNSVFFLGDTLPDGTVAEEVYVVLSDFYIQNFNNNFCVPLDYDFLHSLLDVASRLYELLSIRFYSSIKNGSFCISPRKGIFQNLGIIKHWDEIRHRKFKFSFEAFCFL